MIDDIESERKKIHDWVFSQETSQTLTQNSDEDTKTIWREQLVLQLVRLATPQVKEPETNTKDLLVKEVDRLLDPSQGQPNNELIQVQLKKTKEELPRLERKALVDLKTQDLEKGVVDDDIIMEWRNHEFEPEFTEPLKEELQKLSQKYAAENAALQKTLSQKDAQIATLKAILARQELALAKNADNESILKLKQEELKTDLGDELQIVQYEAAKKLEALQHKLFWTESDLKHREEDITGLEEALGRTQKLTTQFDEMELEHQATNWQMGELQTYRDELEIQLEEAKKRLRERYLIESELMKKLAREKIEHAEKIEQLSLDFKTHQASTSKYEEQLRDQIRQLKESIIKQDQQEVHEATQLRTDLNTSFTQISEIQEKINVNTKLLDQMSELQSKMAKLQKDLSEAHAQVNILKGEKIVNKDKIRSLRVKVAARNQVLDENYDEIKELDNEIEELIKSRRKLKAKANELEQELISWEKKLKEGELIKRTETKEIGTQTDFPLDAHTNAHHQHRTLTLPTNRKRHLSDDTDQSNQSKPLFANFQAWAKCMDGELAKLQEQLNKILGGKKYSPRGDEGPWVHDDKKCSGQILGKFVAPNSPLHNAIIFRSTTHSSGRFSDIFERAFIVVAKQCKSTSIDPETVEENYIDKSNPSEQTITTAITDNYPLNIPKKQKTSQEVAPPLLSPTSPRKPR